MTEIAGTRDFRTQPLFKRVAMAHFLTCTKAEIEPYPTPQRRNAATHGRGANEVVLESQHERELTCVATFSRAVGRKGADVQPRGRTVKISVHTLLSAAARVAEALRCK